jgi:hypothetical protein
MSEIDLLIEELEDVENNPIKPFVAIRIGGYLRNYKYHEYRIAELEAENAELKERVAMLDVNSIYRSLAEMGHIEQVYKLNARIAELKELLDTESQLSNQFYLLLVDNPKSKKLADDLIEALRINGKEVQE